MHDPTPEVSLEILERLCEKADVYAAAVVLPGVNDGKELEKTCEWLDDRGAKGIILMRFANATEQGLLLGNGPIIKNQKVQTVESFRDTVSRLNKKYPDEDLRHSSLGPGHRIAVCPAGRTGAMAKLPRVTRRATVISGSIASPFIDRILSACGSETPVIPVRKEIACLITIDDLKTIDTKLLEPAVIIPGRAFVHDAEAQEVLSRDGNERLVIRGPEQLTADAETSMGMTRDQVLAMEMDGFADLIRTINRYGT